MEQADGLVRDARRAAGLSQAALAARLGMTQSAIAKLERPGANPTVATLDRVLRATGHRLQLLAPVSIDHGVDIDRLRRSLAMTPAERLASFERLQRQEAARTAAARARRDRC